VSRPPNHTKKIGASAIVSAPIAPETIAEQGSVPYECHHSATVLSQNGGTTCIVRRRTLVGTTHHERAPTHSRAYSTSCNRISTLVLVARTANSVLKLR